MIGAPVNRERCRRLALRAIRDLELDLRGWTVLTEAATGSYALTPLIAALAGAPRVLGLARASRYGAVDEVRALVQSIGREWGVMDRIHVMTDRSDPQLSDADIITNLGFVRPIDAAFVERLKPTAVVPLMWETWEFRAADLDLPACRRRGIPVLGTNERHPRLRTFDYIGAAAVRLLHELGVEVLQSELIVLGGDVFAAPVSRVLEGLGAVVTRFPCDRVPAQWRDLVATADAMVVVEHQSTAELIGGRGLLPVAALAAANPGLCVAHICGCVDAEALRASGIRFAPATIAPRGRMSITTDYAGPRPLIDLHTAGLRVGQVLAQCTAEGLRGRAAELAAAGRTDLADVFEDDDDAPHRPA